jgi:hypothetical protein
MLQAYRMLGGPFILARGRESQRQAAIAEGIS